MNAEACATVGARLAALIFDKRTRGGRRPAEAHLSEMELAAMLALAVEEGWKRGYAAGRGEPTPEGVTTAHGRMVALAPKKTGPKPGRSRRTFGAALETLSGTVLVSPEGERLSIACPQVSEKPEQP